LVITDQTMPGLTGAELAAEMLQIRPDLPVILCTGYSSIISRDEARSMGIRSFAAKPLGRREMAMLIRKSLNSGP
jgi:two-component system, cell cycle sensor histidine kinase and response regulator CckA